ncbi:ficolin-3-like [Uranotaenia lowii]|uniref:ficolin-3-like n=1 Tax=Uranotaenia lowii TaxID=190385 RepID=UPI00247937FD|nr:ficolin-3-like [Uranotaenia lowii]
MMLGAFMWCVLFGFGTSFGLADPDGTPRQVQPAAALREDFGFELWLAKIELLEQKVVDLEGVVKQLNVKLTGIEEELNEARNCFQKANHLQTIDFEKTAGYKSCSESPAKIPGLIEIRPPGGAPFEVNCDFFYRGGAWTVIQHRFSGEVDFYRSWNEYRDGFGDLKGEFWLGLEKIHRITGSGKFELLIQLTDRDLKLREAQYSLFKVASETEHFTLKSLGQYNGTAGDSFGYHVGMKFTTWDRKNDLMPGANNNCAQYFHGAWWYNNCMQSNLNGRYRGDGESTCWNTINPPEYPWCHGFNSIRMMIRAVE